MKFEDYLVEQADDQKQKQQQQQQQQQEKRIILEQEVEKLQAELETHQAIGKVLHSALHGPVASATNSSLASLLPPHVQELLSEMAMVEEEIVWLERKVGELKLGLYNDRKLAKERKLQLKQQQRRQKTKHQKNYLPLPPPAPPCAPVGDRSVINGDLYQVSKSQRHAGGFRRERFKFRRASAGSAEELFCILPTAAAASPKAEKPKKQHRRRSIMQKEPKMQREVVCYEKPNELSEELTRCLIGIFLDLNQTSAVEETEDSAIVPKHSIISHRTNSKGPKAAISSSFNCKQPSPCVSSPFNGSPSSNIDPYGIMPDEDSGGIRDIGPYKNFIQIGNSSLDISSRFKQTSPAAEKLRDLVQKLGNVDLTFLTYKQKLAFWINIYNSCIMHAFLEHGLPSSQEKLLAIMNKAAINVGGMVFNALAIEHFILRHPCEASYGPVDDKEMLLRHTYGVGYPEPNVTFALCRGNWSSPALRVYTADQVVNELGRAKAEYLEASVGVVRSKRKIVVPKLLQWHMRDFADDMDSLLEWIYSQLSRSGSLKRLMMECLNGGTKSPATKMVEIQPYEYGFRYLLPF
ncbi:unnamed protein product [Linum tenue]|uniref:Uncharacterized protein n=1 Tax=Linum tenue TaxID=586396 RepID=A0AAV0JPX2_9ROSI|nr:unnamed protein product [Linum tenue]